MNKITPQENIKNSLNALSGEFKKALPAHIPVERFVRVVQTAITTNPQLMQADKTSLWAACTKAAAAALMPDGKEAALVTFKSQQGTTVSFMPMIAGILKLVRNSGELASITSQIVYEGDDFDYYVDSEGEHLTHRPLMFGDRGKRLGAYALAKTKDGAVYIEVMTAAQISDIRNVSRSKNNGPWSGPFEEEMWKKSVLRRLSKRLPMSTDVEEVFKRDDELFMPEKTIEGKAQDVTNESPSLDAKVIEPAKPKKSSKLKQALEAESEEEYVDRPAALEADDNALDEALSEETI